MQFLKTIMLEIRKWDDIDGSIAVSTSFQQSRLINENQVDDEPLHGGKRKGPSSAQSALLQRYLGAMCDDVGAALPRVSLLRYRCVNWAVCSPCLNIMRLVGIQLFQVTWSLHGVAMSHSFDFAFASSTRSDLV